MAYLASYNMEPVEAEEIPLTNDPYAHYRLIPNALKSVGDCDYIICVSPDTLICSNLIEIFQRLHTRNEFIPYIIDLYKNTVPDIGFIGIRPKHSLVFKQLVSITDISYDKIVNVVKDLADYSITYKASKRIYHPSESVIEQSVMDHASTSLLRYNQVYHPHVLEYSPSNAQRLFGSNVNSSKIVVTGCEHVIESAISKIRKHSHISCFIDRHVMPHKISTLEDYKEDVLNWWDDKNIPIKIWFNSYVYRSPSFLHELKADKIINLTGDIVLEMEHLLRSFQVPPEWSEELPGDLQHHVNNRYDGLKQCNSLLSYLYYTVNARLSIGSSMDLKSFFGFIKISGYSKIPTHDDWAAAWLKPHYALINSSLDVKYLL